MIQVKALSKKYGDRVAIENLDFSVDHGDVVGFLGPNGAGKSTTMKIITGFMAPSQGEVTVGGFDVFEDPLEVKRQIGYLPEVPPLYPEMRVKEYFGYVSQLKGVDVSQRAKYIDEAIEATGLGSVQNRLIQNLSKGFRQRVGVAQALVSNPEVLILDEPTVGLDPKQVAQMRELIVSLKGRHTIILSTHILPEVQATCDRVIIINEGKIVAEDSIGGLENKMSNHRRVHLRVLRNLGQVEKLLCDLPGVLGVKLEGEYFLLETDHDEAVLEKIASEIVNSNSGLVELKSSTAMGLEEIFIQLTSERSS